MKTLFIAWQGLRYLEPAARQRIDRLEVGEHLRLSRDDDNLHDQFALVLETGEPVTVGYCPRYLNQDLRRVMEVADLELRVERVNREAPMQFRLLCKAVFVPPPGFQLFAADAYQPLAEEAMAA